MKFMMLSILNFICGLTWKVPTAEMRRQAGVGGKASSPKYQILVRPR